MSTDCPRSNEELQHDSVDAWFATGNHWKQSRDIHFHEGDNLGIQALIQFNNNLTPVYRMLPRREAKHLQHVCKWVFYREENTNERFHSNEEALPSFPSGQGLLFSLFFQCLYFGPQKQRARPNKICFSALPSCSIHLFETQDAEVTILVQPFAFEQHDNTLKNTKLTQKTSIHHSTNHHSVPVSTDRAQAT